MKRAEWLELLARAVDGLERWEARWPGDEVPRADTHARAAVEALVERLGGNYPFFHARYAGQMLKPPHPVAWVAHALTSLINPNNHARDGGPPTTEMEQEVVADLAAAVGYSRDPSQHLGHLTAGGTMANLEALWVAARSHPDRAIAISDSAHYTHPRMCEVLGVRTVAIACDPAGRIDVAALAERLDAGGIGTVVATAGTTGLGALDPIDRIAELTRARGVRLHVDAAYGGFFRLLALRDPPLCSPAPLLAMGEADSIVIDPHKHGLQPYGCGCVLFRDPSVARFYAHDSPYTYFTTRDRHLGEISLECSRSGAAAAALWTTLRAIPLEPSAGLGEMLAAGRRAALGWAAAIAGSSRLRLVVEPETDIVVFAPAPRDQLVRASQISAWSERVFDRALERDVYLAKYTLRRSALSALWSDGLEWDAETVTVLRSVLMKPQHEAWWPRLAAEVEDMTAEILR